MKTTTLRFQLKAFLLFSFLSLASTSFGATFTAITSGNFSSSTTWLGGLVPPNNVLLDVIVIPAGVVVNLDQHLTLNGVLAELNVIGSLNTNNNSNLTVQQGSVTGTGMVELHTVSFEPGTALLFLGTLTVNTLNAATVLLASADIFINQTLNLSAGTLSPVTGGSLDVGENATLVFSGGMLDVGAGGTIGLSGLYNVLYLNTSSTTGIELSGSGLSDVIIDVNPGESVSLSNDLTIEGTLALTRGKMDLAGKNLTINGDVAVSGSGIIATTAASNIIINSNGGTGGALNFAGGASTVNNLFVNVGENNTAVIGGNLTIDGTLQLTSGILGFDDATISISGNLTGSGRLSGNQLSTLTINVVGGLATALNFDSEGAVLQNLNISVGSGNEVALGSHLMVHETLSLLNESHLDLDEYTLTLGMNSTLSGTGSFMVSPSSGLMINSNGGVSSLKLNGTIGMLNINSGANNEISLGSDLIVGTLLNLQSGVLVLNNHHLTLEGDLMAAGNALISSNAASNITINTSAGLSGTLPFGNGSAAVNDLFIQVAGNGMAALSGALSVMGSLHLNSGVLGFEDANLSIHGNVTGSGFLHGNAASNLNVMTAGGFATPLKFEANGQSLNNFVLMLGSNNAVSIASNVAIHGDLLLSNGSNLILNGNTLTLEATSTLAGTGALMVNQFSGLIVHSTEGISALKVNGMIGQFTINTGGSASVDLVSNLIIAGMLSLESGILNLNSHNLMINGNIAANGNGSVLSTAASTVSLNSPGGTTGVLDFGTGSSVVNNLVINTGFNNTARIGGQVLIEGMLQLTNGILEFHNASIILNGELNGNGLLSGNTGSNLDIQVPGGLAVPLTFAAGGQFLNDLSLGVGPGNTVSMGSGLTVLGTLDLQDTSYLNLNQHTLTLGLTSDLIGSGVIQVDTLSILDIQAAGGISSLVLEGLLGKLSIHTGGNTPVTLAGDATIAGELNLKSGILNLDGYDLYLHGDVAAGGTGTISSDLVSDIHLKIDSTLSGALRFTPGAQVVGEFSINMKKNGAVLLGSDLTITDTLEFKGGKMDLDSHTLVLGITGYIKGIADTSYLITSAGGSLDMNVTAGDSVAVHFPIGTSTHFAPASISLNAGSPDARVRVGVVSEVLADGIIGDTLSKTEAMVNATWHIDADTTINLDLDLEVSWSGDLEVNGFDHQKAFISHFTNHNWDTVATSAVIIKADGMFSIMRNGISSLSPFAVFNQPTITRIASPKELLFDIYPNPASDYIIIQHTEQPSTPFQIELYSSSGQLMDRFESVKTHTTMSISNLLNGYYYIRLYNQEKMSTHPFVKQ